eukprot:s1667_g17.t3
MAFLRKGVFIDHKGQGMGIRYFDAVLLITSSRFTEAELMLAEELQKFEVPYFMVRNKVDIDIASEILREEESLEGDDGDECELPKEDRERVEQQTINCIKTYFASEYSVDRVYCVSSRRKLRSNHDFPSLEVDILEAIRKQRVGRPQEMDEKQDAPDGFAKLKWQEEKQLRTRPGRFSQERLERKSRREEELRRRMASTDLSLEDAEAFAKFAKATDEQKEQYSDTLASFFAWMMAGSTSKSAANYMVQVKMLMERFQLSLQALASQEFLDLVKKTKENQKRNNIVGAGLKKFQDFVASRGGLSMPWEDPTRCPATLSAKTWNA